MNSPKTWTVVLFESDNSVQAVPTKWIYGDNCLWPILPQDKLVKALKNCEYNSHWPSHKVRIFRNATYEDYTVARTKAVKAEYSSDLNSDNENVKRHRKKKVFSSSESEDEIEKNLKPKKHQKTLPLPPPPPSTWNENKCNVGDTEVNYDIAMMETPVSKDVTERETESVDNIRRNMVGSSTNCACNPQILHNIQSILMEVNMKIDKLVKQPLDSNEKENVLEKSNIIFPISNPDVLTDFENFLSVSENYKAIVSYFTRMGGINTYDYVKRCLGFILTDGLATQYSFIGRKGKKKFCNLLLSKALLESSEKACISKNRRETEISIGCWLRKAKERSTKIIRNLPDVGV